MCRTPYPAIERRLRRHSLVHKTLAECNINGRAVNGTVDNNTSPVGDAYLVVRPSRGGGGRPGRGGNVGHPPSPQLVHRVPSVKVVDKPFDQSRRERRGCACQLWSLKVVRRPSADGNSRSSMILSFMICGARVRGNHGVEPRVLGDQHASVCRGRSKVVGKPTSMGRCYNKGAVAFVESKRTDAKPTLTQAPFLPATAQHGAR